MTGILRGALAALLLLLAVGCSDSADKEGADKEEADDPTAKVKVELGKKFTWNDFTVADGWALDVTTQTIDLEKRDQPYIEAEVTNDGDEPRFALFELVFAGDDELQATIHCTSEKIPVGKTASLSCMGFGQPVPQGYDLIQVQEITR